MLPGMRLAKRTREDLKVQKEALNESFLAYKSIGAIGADPEFVFTVAELIRQLAIDEFVLTDPTPLFCMRAQAELGQTIELEEYVNSMRMVRRFPGSQALVFQPIKRKYPIVTKEYDLPFGIDLEKVLRRELTPAVFAEHAAQALSRIWVNTVLTTIDAAEAAGSTDHYGRPLRFTSVGSLIQTSLDSALQALGDVNTDMFIAGRYFALFPITGFSGFSNLALEEIRQTGLVGYYKGAKVVLLRDDYNWWTGEIAIPSNRIYLGGGNKGAWLHERDVAALNYQYIDHETAWLKTGFRLDFGVTVVQPWKYRVCDLV
jgi:hypothetical protein